MDKVTILHKDGTKTVHLAEDSYVSAIGYCLVLPKGVKKYIHPMVVENILVESIPDRDVD